MNSRRWFFVIVVLQMIIIAALVANIMAPKKFSIQITPFAQADILHTPSDHLKYFYDLATESSTSIPEWLPSKPVYIRNADQLNDRFDYSVTKPPSTFRIITLGDSWTFGMHVSTKDNYSEVLEDMLNANLKSGALVCKDIQKFEVLNFGVGGYDLEYMVERLKLRGMKYDPDLIIPLIKYDDFVLVNELWTPRIEELQKEYGPALNETIVNGKAVNPRGDIGQKVNDELLAQYSPTDLTNYEARSLDRLSSFYKAKIVFMIYGSLTPVQEQILTHYAENRPGTYITPTLGRLSPAETIINDGHPNASGHASIAKALYGDLFQEGVIPCQVSSR